MRIKLDENLPAELANDLRRLGHVVDSVTDEGLAGRADSLVGDAARRARSILELLPDIEKRQPLKGLLLVASDSGIRVRRQGE
jgi:hypothetical protein